jgi:hypothetical protein
MTYLPSTGNYLSLDRLKSGLGSLSAYLTRPRYLASGEKEYGRKEPEKGGFRKARDTYGGSLLRSLKVNVIGAPIAFSLPYIQPYLSSGLTTGVGDLGFGIGLGTEFGVVSTVVSMPFLVGTSYAFRKLEEKFGKKNKPAEDICYGLSGAIPAAALYHALFAAFGPPGTTMSETMGEIHYMLASPFLGAAFWSGIRALRRKPQVKALQQI